MAVESGRARELALDCFTMGIKTLGSVLSFPENFALGQRLPLAEACPSLGHKDGRFYRAVRICEIRRDQKGGDSLLERCGVQAEGRHCVSFVHCWRQP